MTKVDRTYSLSGKGSSDTQPVDINWEPDTSFAYQATEEVLCTGQMTISAFGTGVQPVATEPPDIVEEPQEDGTDYTTDTGEENITADLLPKTSHGSTPQHNVLRKVRSVSWCEHGTSNSSADDGDVSSQSSATETEPSKGKAKWLQDNGQYQLDRAETSSLSLFQEHHDPETTQHLTKELADAIASTCAPKNKDRFKVELKQGILPTHSDITYNKKGLISKARAPALSDLKVDLSDKSALSNLVKSHSRKTSKKLAELFGQDAEFDRALIHRMAGPKHKLPYCTSNTDAESSGFSPTIAILHLGSTAAARPLFLRSTTGGIVTHKVLLHPGSLCVLSGRAATNYRFSIPKDYGTAEGEQFFIIFFQRTPNKSILEELQKISILNPASEIATPVETPINPEVGTALQFQASPPPVEAKSVEIEEEEKEETSIDTAVEVPIPVTEDTLKKLRLSVAIETDNNQVLQQGSLGSKTPLTAIPRNIDFSFDFKDSIDIEPCSKLILADTLETVVEKMDNNQVALELMRHQAPTSGNTDQMRKRLMQTIVMAIGEMSTPPTSNTSINMLQQPSPDIVPNNFINDVQKILICQDNIDKSLVQVIDRMERIQDAVKSLPSGETVELSDVTTPSTLKSEEVAALKKLFEDTRLSIITHSTGLKTMTNKIGNFTKNIEDSKSLLKGMVNTIRECDKDMKDWRSSVFSDESTTKINYIHEYVQKCWPETSDAAIQTNDEEAPCETTVAEHNWGDQEVEDKEQPFVQDGAVTTPDVSNAWAPRSDIPLEQALLKGSSIKVCLITDSIMRHIGSLASTWQYKFSFSRIDCRDSTGLCSANTRDELKRLRPHIVYVHLGINDIHRGADKADVIDHMRDFHYFMDDWLPETRIVFSLPLPNGKQHHERLIAQLRSSISLYVNQGPSSSDKHKIHLQPNNSMMLVDENQEMQQKSIFFQNNDRVHLTERGKSAMLHSLRGMLHRIFKSMISQ